LATFADVGEGGAENLYRIRIGDYRVIYQVLHGSREVTVIYIRHRSVAYRGLLYLPPLG